MLDPSQDRAVSVLGAKRVIVKYLIIDGYCTGIYLQRSTHSTVSGNTISKTSVHAVHLSGSSRFNLISDNRIHQADQHGVALWSSDGNAILNNVVSSVRDGIRLQHSFGNTIMLNEVTDVKIEGVDLHDATHNTILLNAIKGTTPLPLLSDGGPNKFSLSLAGNHYSTVDTVLFRCADRNADGVCDSPYRFPVESDFAPLVLDPRRAVLYRRP